jgi:cytochrome c-type biogenesis protein CcmH/NrfG
VRLLLADARAYRAEQQWLPAQAGYTRILRLDPSDREARSGLIEALVASGNRTVALQKVKEWDVNRATNDLPTDLHVGLYLSLEE